MYIYHTTLKLDRNVKNGQDDIICEGTSWMDMASLDK